MRSSGEGAGAHGVYNGREVVEVTSGLKKLLVPRGPLPARKSEATTTRTPVGLRGLLSDGDYVVAGIATSFIDLMVFTRMPISNALSSE